MIRYPVGQPSISTEEVEAVLETIQSGRITQGERVRQFEEAMALRLHVKHVIACSSGTAALHLALTALGISTGDEVIVPDLTYVATANAVSYTGATPVFVDVDSTWCLDMDRVIQVITDRTKAIIPVHLYGVPCDMEVCLDLAGQFNLAVIEDAAEALGGSWNSRPCGTIGDVGTFSFYANKVMTTCEGGAVVTNDDGIAHAVNLLRGQAQTTQRFYHDRIGFNYRLSDLHASIGIVQEQRLDQMLFERARVVDTYRELLSDLLDTPDVDGTVPWLFTGTFRSEHSYDNVAEVLARQGIETRPIFVPMHQLPMYRQSDNLFPNATRIARQGLSLPTWPELTDGDVTFIANATRNALHE